MSYFLKYRPSTLDNLIGQSHISDVLKSQISSWKINNNYLFYGPRGTWKTTVARILAKAVNCSNPKSYNPCNECQNCLSIINEQNLDFVEIDAASHTQVDNIREEIIDKSFYPPSSLKKKIYIIDEVHMLSKSAFNALLKIMEEPPSYIMFILATTEINKVPDTIISRTQVFNFRNLSQEDIKERLEHICNQENIEYEDNALCIISKISEGAVRDSIKYLEQISSFWKVTEDNVINFLGVAPNYLIKEFLENIKTKNFEKINLFLEKLQETWIDLTIFIKQVLLYIDEEFSTDPEFYTELSTCLNNILFSLKNHPTPILIYKSELYKYIQKNN